MSHLNDIPTTAEWQSLIGNSGLGDEKRGDTNKCTVSLNWRHVQESIDSTLFFTTAANQAMAHFAPSAEAD